MLVLAGTGYFGWKEYVAVLAAKYTIHPEALYIHLLGFITLIVSVKAR